MPEQCKNVAHVSFGEVGEGREKWHGPSTPASGTGAGLARVDVTSNAADVLIEVMPPDVDDLDDDRVPFARRYTCDTTVTLVAPGVAPNGNDFSYWILDGITQLPPNLTLQFDATECHEAIAVYGIIIIDPPCGPGGANCDDVRLIAPHAISLKTTLAGFMGTNPQADCNNLAYIASETLYQFAVSGCPAWAGGGGDCNAVGVVSPTCEGSPLAPCTDPGGDAPRGYNCDFVCVTPQNNWDWWATDPYFSLSLEEFSCFALSPMLYELHFTFGLNINIGYTAIAHHEDNAADWDCLHCFDYYGSSEETSHSFVRMVLIPPEEQCDNCKVAVGRALIQKPFSWFFNVGGFASVWRFKAKVTF